MRLFLTLAMILGITGASLAARAEDTPVVAKPPKDAPQVQVNAEKSLEYYQDKKLYVARGNAKAVRGTLTVTADILTAHEREKKPGEPKQPKNKNGNGGDIDTMTADGNVVIFDQRQRITGDHAVYDIDKHKMIVTGDNLRYETAKEVVTARDSLEYYEDTKMAIARGHAIADQPTRHIEGDILTAEFRDAPNGQTQLNKMSAQGHVTIITKSSNETSTSTAAKPKSKGGDVSRGDRASYDADSNTAVLNGDVRITRADGTQLSGDAGEVNFTTNQNRLIADPGNRAKALLPAKTTNQAITPAMPAAGTTP